MILAKTESGDIIHGYAPTRIAESALGRLRIQAAGHVLRAPRRGRAGRLHLGRPGDLPSRPSMYGNAVF
jgi:hypothetical protein